MKKSLIVAAVLSTIAGAAAAQSSVTLFGVVDLNARYLKNGSLEATKQLASDGLTTNRLGFRGVEDLGGGLKAGFWLESALSPDTGTAGVGTRFWHRRSTVSLEGGFGEVRLGRDFTPMYNSISSFDPFSDTGLGAYSSQRSTLGTSADTQTRSDNQVSYFLPKNLGGIYGQLSLAPGENTFGKNYAGVRVGFEGRGLNVSGTYGETKVNAAEDKFTVMGLGASYDFKVVKAMVSVAQYKAKVASVTSKQQSILAGATVPVGSAGLIRASFQNTNQSGTTALEGADSDKLSLGYVHNLSKRTALYANVAQISNKSDANGSAAFSLSGSSGSAAGTKSKGFDVGVRHSF